MASLLVGVAYADEPIKTAYSDSIQYIQFDGEWTFGSEWKNSSDTKFEYDQTDAIILRTAHEDKFFYVFIDYLTDFTNAVSYTHLRAHET